MTIRVGQLVIHTETEKQKTGITINIATKQRLILRWKTTICVLSEEVTIQAAHALSLTISVGFLRCTGGPNQVS